MSIDHSACFPVAPVDLQSSSLVTSGDWQFHFENRSANVPQVIRVATFEAVQPNIHTRISFNPDLGWQIIEGWQPEDPQGEGNQGVVIMGSSLNLSTQGWALIDASRVKDSTILTVSIAEQTRRSVDTNSKVAGTIRGFNAPQISPDNMAAIEMYEEAGMSIKQHIVEVGLPVNMMPLWMVSRARGGANFFSIKFPSRLLELTDEKRRRWRIKNGIFQADAPHKEFEGVSRSEFVDISEIVSQKIWSGTADGYTVISGARTLIDNCRLDFGGFWNKLVRQKKLTQQHSVYPIRRLESKNYGELIGQSPLWEIKVNNESVHLNSLWARNIKTNEEVAYGDKPEATRYDGFVINSSVTAVMPLVEIDGRLYAGGHYSCSENINDGRIFCSPTINRVAEVPGQADALSVLSESIQMSQLDTDGIIVDIKPCGGPINPNSAHGTWTTEVVFARINASKMTQVGQETYHIDGSDPNFIFIPVEKVVMETSHGPTVIAASVACSGARIVALK